MWEFSVFVLDCTWKGKKIVICVPQVDLLVPEIDVRQPINLFVDNFKNDITINTCQEGDYITYGSVIVYKVFICLTS